MLKLMRFLVVVIALGMLLGAIGFMFYPWMMQGDFAVVASRVDGMGTIRGDLGGLFLMLSIFTFYGCLRRKSQWLMVPIVFMLTVSFRIQMESKKFSASTVMKMKKN